jgi:hypothetical protein
LLGATWRGPLDWQSLRCGRSKGFEVSLISAIISYAEIFWCSENRLS